jgi:anti-sigma factor RsiW
MTVPRNPEGHLPVGGGEPEPERTDMSSPDFHPASERLEARAAGELAPDEARALDAHLQVCARCRSEVEGWTLLLGELRDLPARAPAPDFVARVMAQVDVDRVRQGAQRPPLASRLVERLGDPVFGIVRRLRQPHRHPADRRSDGTSRLGGPSRHLTPAGIQDYLEGALAAHVRSRVDAHLATCTACSGEVAQWSEVFLQLEALPALAPREGFRDRVMAQVQVEAVAIAAARQPLTPWQRASEGLARLARRLLPTTRRGWILAGGLAAAPTLGVVAVVASVVLNPLVSFPDLLTFFRWRALDAVGSLGSGLLSLLTENPLTFALLELLAGAAQASPLALGGAFALTAALVGTATLVVYRNLIAPSLTGETHVQPTS